MRSDWRLKAEPAKDVPHWLILLLSRGRVRVPFRPLVAMRASRFFSLSQSGERQERCASEPLPKTAIPISIRSTAWRLVAGELRRGLEDPDTAARTYRRRRI